MKYHSLAVPGIFNLPEQVDYPNDLSLFRKLAVERHASWDKGGITMGGRTGTDELCRGKEEDEV